jgi:hypothetical protein
MLFLKGSRLSQARRRVENARYQEVIDEYLREQEKLKWEERCQTLREQCVMVKDLPKKAKRPLKPKLKEVDEDEDGERSVSRTASNWISSL